MRVGGDAGDIIDGDTGEDGRNISIGKGNRQSDYSNRLNVNMQGDRQYKAGAGVEDRLMDIERVVYGEPRWSEPGLIKRQQTHQRISQWNMALSIATFILLIAVFFWR
jgi:hypothetical protein